MNKINLPFTKNNIKGGNSFKILDQKELNKKKSKTIVNMVKNMFDSNPEKSNNSNTKINYIRASTTKEYYNKK